MLRSLYAGIHDPASPVSVQRPNTLRAMVELLFREFELAGRPRRSGGCSTSTSTPSSTPATSSTSRPRRPAQDVANARQVMLRMALATLGSPRDWETFHDNPHLFDAPGDTGAGGTGPDEPAGGDRPSP